MCVKLSPGDLNLSPYPLHPTNTYTCGVTTKLRVHGGYLSLILVMTYLVDCNNSYNRMIIYVC